jgi:single-strand DNA-binding protein
MHPLRDWEHALLADRAQANGHRKGHFTIMNFNQLTLVGFIGGDAETTTSKTGRPVTKFSVATNQSWKAANGEWQEARTWCQVVAYGEGFAKLADRLLKGKHVLIQGRLKTDTYDREIEVTHKNKPIKVTVKQTSVECIADTIRVLDRKSKDVDQISEEQEVPA